MKHALITGGTQNTGYVIARQFLKAGYAVHITSRKADDAAAAAEKLRREIPGASVFPYQLELGKVADVQRLFSEIDKNTDSLDVFVSNAASLGVDVDVFTADEEAFDAVMDVNVKGVFFACREAAKRMKEKGGSMVLVSSVQSKSMVEGRCVYGMSKSAVNTMSRYMAFDLAPYNIRVNCIIAGAIHTERWDALSEEVCAARRANYPLGEEATMAEIADAALYFASDSSAHTTGTEIVIDSGLLLSALPYRDRKVLKHEGF